jgi:ribosomal protein S18 acetylase RimI-like enzyme
MTDIRAANPSDADGIARVYVETWRNTYAGVLPDHVLVGMSEARQRRAWENAIRGRREAVVVAEQDGHIVGVGSAGPARKAGLGFPGEVYTLYVLPDYQNQGIGRRLMTRLFAAIREKHGNSAVIWVLAANPSRFFYEVMGGKRVGERDERLWGVVLHEIAYGWPDLTAVTGVS